MNKVFSPITAVLAVCALLQIQCSIPLRDEGSPSIYGTWRWLSSSGGFIGEVSTPESSGHTITLLFQRSNTYAVYRDGEIQQRGIFSRARLDGEEIIRYDPQEDAYRSNQFVEFLHPDTLLLMDTCFDCYISLYARKTGD